MFLHLGGEILVNQKEIVAILDLESAHNAAITKEFMEIVSDEGIVDIIGEKGKEKSLIITTKNIYLSPISSSTLMKRANSRTLTLETE